MFSNKPLFEIEPAIQLRFFYNLFGIASLIYCIGIFNGWFIETGFLVGILNAAAAIAFFFNGYRIKIKVSRKKLVLNLLLALSQATWVAGSINSHNGYLTPLPFLAIYLALFPSYRLYKLVKNDTYHNIESTKE